MAAARGWARWAAGTRPAQSSYVLPLPHPPTPNAQDRNFALVMKALLAAAAREEALGAFLDAVAGDADLADAAMKYVLRGLKAPDNAPTLLKVHGLLLERAGMGCLVRAMVDRKTA